MKKNVKAAVLIVIDAVGIETLSYLIKHYNKKINLPCLSALGIKKVLDKDIAKMIDGNIKMNIKSSAISLNQSSKTADSLIGHREMMGLIDNNTYNLFPDGFPQEYLRKLEKAVGRKTFFNKMCGGIEAIEKNYERHEKTGDLIVYASKCDPLVQIAMNEDIIPLDEQRFIVDTAFKIARDMNIPITRAIARSYIRRNNEIIRTPNRHDTVMPMSSKCLIDLLNDRKVWTVAVGKTSDLVNTKYYEKIKLTEKEFIDPSLNLRFPHPAKKDTNPFNVQGTINAIKTSEFIYRPEGTFIFTNLVDTDSLYGHTRDIKGAIKSLEETDSSIKKIIDMMGDDTLLFITADHGMEHREDYGYHNNEKLFLITSSKKSFLPDIKTDIYPGLTSVGGAISEYFNLSKEYKEIVKEQASVK
ncbi:MAG: hypothetical protein GX445_02890 [Elusimicrobia bacterium]|nr:hypothetical protein [Elusimicrobiota bacterium]